VRIESLLARRVVVAARWCVVRFTIFLTLLGGLVGSAVPRHAEGPFRSSGEAGVVLGAVIGVVVGALVAVLSGPRLAVRRDGEG
jgi:hypothetical protein